MIVNETLPVISDPVLGGGVPSVIVSTVLIVMYVFSLVPFLSHAHPNPSEFVLPTLPVSSHTLRSRLPCLLWFNSIHCSSLSLDYIPILSAWPVLSHSPLAGLHKVANDAMCRMTRLRHGRRVSCEPPATRAAHVMSCRGSRGARVFKFWQERERSLGLASSPSSAKGALIATVTVMGTRIYQSLARRPVWCTGNLSICDGEHERVQSRGRVFTPIGRFVLGCEQFTSDSVDRGQRQ